MRNTTESVKRRAIKLPRQYEITVRDNDDDTIDVHCEICGRTWRNLKDRQWPDLHAEVHQ